MDHMQLLDRQRPRIAIWTETSWAFGRIAQALQRSLEPEFEVHILSWHEAQLNNVLFDHLWKTYDLILSNTAILGLPIKYNITTHMSQALLDRIGVIIHCPLLNQEFYTETIDPEYRVGPRFAAVCHKGVESLRLTGLDGHWTPFGADLTLFPERPLHTTLKRAGFIGAPDACEKVKRPSMFIDICEQAGLQPVFLHGMPLTAAASMYDSIDVLIVCSAFESGPLGAFEAAAQGIPVLSTPVGNWQMVDSVKCFDTVAEAVRQLRAWVEAPHVLAHDVAKVTGCVRAQWSMEYLIGKYTKPWIRQCLKR